jgi:hypothetical protein
VQLTISLSNIIFDHIKAFISTFSLVKKNQSHTIILEIIYFLPFARAMYEKL